MSDFDGERLRLIRELRAVTKVDLAQRVGVSPSFLSKAEQGERMPAALSQAALAEALGVDRSFFGRPAHGVDERACNFRSRRTTAAYLRASAIARGGLLEELVAELDARVDGIPAYAVPRSTTVHGVADAEAAAAWCRSQLGLGNMAPIHDMVGLLEHLGVFVTRLRAGTDKIDAFSWPGAGRAFVVLGSDKQSGSRSRFDAAHELGHLVMHEPTAESDRREREREADAFASAFLMPKHAFVREFPGMRWTALFEMKKRWGTSLASILYSAHRLDLISAIEYRRAYKQMSARGWRRCEPHEPRVEVPTMLSNALGLVNVDALLQRLGWSTALLEEVTGCPALPSETTEVGLRAAPNDGRGGEVIDLAARRVSPKGTPTVEQT